MKELSIQVYDEEIRVNGEIVSINDLTLAALPEDYLESGELYPLRIEGKDNDSDIILVVDEGNAEAGHHIRIVHSPEGNWFFQYIKVAWRR